MQRRNFIKKTCIACMSLAAGGLLLESCGSSLPVLQLTPTNQQLFIPIQKFSAQNNLLLVRSRELENDILLIKNKNLYKAIYMECTHEGVGLTATNKNIVCAAHGSKFDFDGQVLSEPALKPLKVFATETKNDNIIIYLK